MARARVPYSGFLRGPTDVLARLAFGDVVLERRDGDDLVLSTAERDGALREGLAVGIAALRMLAREQPEMVADGLRDALPWLRWLPEKDRADCVRELLDDLAASVNVENFTRFQHDLAAWRSTAGVWADPELAERLQEDFAGDGKPRVPRPATVG